MVLQCFLFLYLPHTLAPFQDLSRSRSPTFAPAPSPSFTPAPSLSLPMSLVLTLLLFPSLHPALVSSIFLFLVPLLPLYPTLPFYFSLFLPRSCPLSSPCLYLFPCLCLCPFPYPHYYLGSRPLPRPWLRPKFLPYSLPSVPFFAEISFQEPTSLSLSCLSRRTAGVGSPVSRI